MGHLYDVSFQVFYLSIHNNTETPVINKWLSRIVPLGDVYKACLAHITGIDVYEQTNKQVLTLIEALLHLVK